MKPWRLVQFLAASAIATAANAQTLPDSGRPASPAERRRLMAERQQALATAQRLRQQQQQIVRTAERHRVSHLTLRSALARQLEANPKIDDEGLVRLVEALAREVSEARSLIEAQQARIAAAENAEERLPAQQGFARAEQAIEAGRLEEAREEVATVRQSAAGGGRRAAPLSDWIAAVEAEARLAMLAADYEGAAALYLAALRDEPGLPTETRWRFAIAASDARYRQGDLLGNNEALARSIEILRETALPSADRALRQRDWAETQNRLGRALAALGERERGTARLEEAIAAYRGALQVQSRDGEPQDRAVTLINLGGALMRLAARRSEPALDEQAILVLREALSALDRRRAPAEWAAAHNVLGLVLFSLGGDERGTARLEQSVTAFRQALLARSRDSEPLDWAVTQNNLGNSLSLIGTRESGTGRFEEAVTAYRGALSEYSRESTPVLWAMAYNNLGTALRHWGERENSIPRLQQAVAAYRLSLLEWTRERSPLEWARVQANLGNALSMIGERQGGRPMLEEAIVAYRRSLSERTRATLPHNWAETALKLSLALGLIAQGGGGEENLREAQALARDAQALLANSHNRGLADWSNYVVEQLALMAQRLGSQPK